MNEMNDNAINDAMEENPMTPTPNRKIVDRDELRMLCQAMHERGQRIVFTNGCFDLLHAGHVELLERARSLGDFLVVGLNADSSVRRLKGDARPLNDEQARATVLAALAVVDAVHIFPEDTPVETLEVVKPNVHVKGGDYRADDLPEAATVRALGGEIEIVPLRAGFSTTGLLERAQANGAGQSTTNTTATGAAATGAAATGATRCLIAIPARYGSTRFPGKPLALLGGSPVIAHVIRAALRSKAERPVLVATDDQRIVQAVRSLFHGDEVRVVMTSPACYTGTDRLAEAMRATLGDEATCHPQQGRTIVINVQGDEPFINPAHIDLLIEAMQEDTALQMATLAMPIRRQAQVNDPNVVKVVCDLYGHALYFSRHSLPFVRDSGEEQNAVEKLRHLGVYAYEVSWLCRMAQLPPTPLEECEKLEQLRALENGVAIKVLRVDEVNDIAIDTPQDLERAQRFLQQHLAASGESSATAPSSST